MPADLPDGIEPESRTIPLGLCTIGEHGSDICLRDDQEDFDGTVGTVIIRIRAIEAKGSCDSFRECTGGHVSAASIP